MPDHPSISGRWALYPTSRNPSATSTFTAGGNNLGFRLKTSESTIDRPVSIRGRIIVLLSVFAVVTAVVLSGLLLYLRADALDAGAGP